MALDHRGDRLRQPPAPGEHAADEGVIDAEFAPHMLYITNDDKPGFIGRLGTLLGEGKVNIATFHLGRDKPGGSAIALVQVEQPISPELMGRIGGIEGVMQAKVLGF